MNVSSSATIAVTTETKELKDGYDLPVYGLANGTFYGIHVPALICICLSLICVISVISYSFYHQHISTFFHWTICERFAVYMAICDGLFNISHFSDHLHIVLTKELPTPKYLCAFYGFLLAEFVTAQNLLVSIVAINVFVLVYFRKKLDFGCKDYRLLVFIFGAPALGLTVAAGLGQLGPNGSFCFFDGVNGHVANFIFTTIFLSVITMTNIILYIISWFRIYKEVKAIKNPHKSLEASHRAAKTMSLFVTAFLVQWWAMATYGIWQWETDVPQILFHFVTTFSNLGGVLNGLVFIIIVRRKHDGMDSSSNTHDIKESTTDKQSTCTEI
ncbi:unnamed protein product [Mytilus edulis]|uniref:G-protein coupled receptors family 1 profile domain-containing protein n=1 Tax=Mytilus edulis TaxID=6550 RepID=A0A8S3Q1S1_MYTED|nr:unnamed protein product [Mytilus edulis]